MSKRKEMLVESTLIHQLQCQCFIMMGQCSLSSAGFSKTREFTLRVSILILVFVHGPATRGGCTSRPWNQVQFVSCLVVWLSIDPDKTITKKYKGKPSAMSQSFSTASATEVIFTRSLGKLCMRE